MPGDEGHGPVGPGHLDPAPAGQPPMTAHEVDVGALQPLDLTGVVPVMREVVPALEHGRHVQGTGHRLARPAHPLGGEQRLHGPQESLARHARPVGALAADKFRLDHHGRKAPFDGPVGDVLACGAGPDDYDVVLTGLGHAFSYPDARGYGRAFNEGPGYEGPG